MNRTISAEFDTMDDAELTARTVRRKIDGISGIKIKYRHLDGEGMNDVEYSIFATPYIVGGNFGMAFPQNYTAIYRRKEEENHDGMNFSSTVTIEADENAAKKIASYVRASGGRKVTIS